MNFDDIRFKGFSKRLKVEEAIKKYISELNLFPSESILLKEASIQNKILRDDIHAKRSIPPFDRSAVDGYAVQAADTFSASETNPMILKIIDKIAIGEISSMTVEKGTAIQIPTGGAIPIGADAVIMVEDTTEITKGTIEVNMTSHPGKNISKSGEDFQKGQLIFQSGHRFRSIDRGFLLSAGITNIKVSHIPKVAIIVTGDELVEPWNQITPGKIPEINSVNLFDLCTDEGWEPEIVGIIQDQKDALKDVIAESAKKFDVILVNGGSSVGKKDYTPVIFNELGKIIFHGLAMRPGGPILGARIQNKVVFGVPGFPTASIIAFRFVIRPIILSLMGMKENFSPITVLAEISRNVGSKLGRLDFLRVKIEKSSSRGYQAVPIQIGGSGILTNIVEANGFVPIPESSEGLKEGDIVEVILW